jgi:hypothetical protein
MFWDNLTKFFRPSHRQRKRILVQLKDVSWEELRELDKSEASKVIDHLESINKILNGKKEE